MELYQEILRKLLEQETVQATFPGLDTTPGAMVESACYRALNEIKAVMEDDSLDDPQCFQRIEEIMRVYESIGSGIRSRHDF